MNTAMITIKTPKDVKEEAQKTAKALGFSLSSLINAYLRQLIKSKAVHFTLEEPSEYLITELAESKLELQQGYVSPEFAVADDAIAWLHEKEPPYEGQIQQKVQKTVR